MDQIVNILWVIDKAHIVTQGVQDCGPDLGGLN